MIQVMYNGQASLEGPGSPFNREDHEIKELELMNGSKRAPRRAQTQYEYQLPQPPAITVYTIRQQPQPTEDQAPETPTPGETPASKDAAERPRPRRRPPLGPPRRSYSVTDQQPIPHHHRPSARLALTDLPGELHFAIFDFLDPIDSTCLGLTNSHMYAIHRRLHGTVALTIRRDGPNELEWAWHLAARGSSSGGACGAQPPPAPRPVDGEGLGEHERENALARLRVRGQAYCRMCGVTRCQLHKHVQEWMGQGLEYCSVRQRFGAVAPAGAKSYCYMSKPGDNRRCGRHVVRKDRVQLR
ncbi:hypothetical protein BT67DRAFT_44734 [Trichocladium antarcticum]|uniref:F-box domain-containing protein n=1 Tax=Trichocladium antarcticum TaxID=1450529 RepID=A0AAN6UIT9_9PEZI|nr:hypothetical protein BT67DRAFT_44734 [Trichocladium antarcticum]